VIALFPLNIVLFPGGPLPLRIFESRYIDMVSRCMREGAGFGVIYESSDVGTMADIVDFHQLSDGLLGLSCIGRRRFRILSRQTQADGLNLAEVDELPLTSATPVPARHTRLAELLKNVLPQLGEVYEGIEMHLDEAAWVGYRLAEILPIPLADKQRLLELDDAVQRLDALSPLAPAVPTKHA